MHNVLGAFSSNKGEDFRAVLETICKVKDGGFSVPEPPNGKWSNAGEIVGALCFAKRCNFSIAWRVLDAQYWGVPQRRRRIFLVADFDSCGVGKVLFESEGMSAYSAECFRAWQGAAVAAENCPRTAGGAALIFENHVQDARISGPLDIAPTVSASYGTGGNNQPLVMNCFDVRFTSEGTKNVRANVYESESSRTIDCGGNSPDRNQGGLAVVTYGIGRAAFNQGKNALYNFEIEQELEPTVLARGPGAVATPIDDEYIVRRLTPTECAGLQGFPDWWCADLGEENPTAEEISRWRQIFEEYRAAIGKPSKPKTDKQIVKWLKNPHSDSAEYKLWGNGVALPCVFFVLAGIVWYNSDNKLRECLYTSDVDKSAEKIYNVNTKRRIAMKINFNVTGARRKEFVKTVCEILDVQPEYLRMPTAAYRIDYFTVDKDGVLEFDDRADSKEIENLLERLAERGYCAVKAQNNADNETMPQTQNAPQNANFGLVVEMPKECVNVENINNLISAKGELIKRTLAVNELPIEVTGDTVKFSWFSRELSADEVKAYTHLISAMCRVSKESKRINAAASPIVNEKYEFRCFLLRLGFIGSEYKDERKVLLKNLEGSAAFKFTKQQS